MHNRFVRPVLLIFCLAFVLFCSGCNKEFRLDHGTDEYDKGYETGYREGYADGTREVSSDDVPAAAGVYYEIEDMEMSDIIKYVESSGDLAVLQREDLYALFAYALQRGYVAGRTGTWDDVLEEYVNGYDVSAEGYAFERSFGSSGSKGFTAWQSWAAGNN